MNSFSRGQHCKSHCLCCVQVVCPCVPVGQLDGALGESCADRCHLSLLAVPLRHSGPQQLSKTRHPGISRQQPLWSTVDRGCHKSEANSRHHFGLTVTLQTTLQKVLFDIGYLDKLVSWSVLSVFLSWPIRLYKPRREQALKGEASISLSPLFLCNTRRPLYMIGLLKLCWFC